MITSSPLYVYLQRPDTGQWVTVGRYSLDASGQLGRFLYAPSYLEAGFGWSIDPVNLPLIAGNPINATRYGGLHDVLRDACPDSWGRLLIQREHGLGDTAHSSAYLLLASNADRWGALAIGKSPKPSIAKLSTPKLAQLPELSEELLAMYERRPAVNPQLRRRLMATPSMGGARPKVTVQDGNAYWLVKPVLPSDTVDIPLLEHVVQRWGKAAGLNFAHTEHESAGSGSGLSVVRSLRFDRSGDQRIMAVSGASLLQTEYPGAAGSASWSYPVLATVLRQIGAPLEDSIELFSRMVFNAVIGNDDDHPRNHAIHYSHEQRRWRLTPAFDVVPNPDFIPSHLALQVCFGDRSISTQNILREAQSFGFESQDHAEQHLETLLNDIEAGYEVVESMFTEGLRSLMGARLNEGIRRLRVDYSP